MVHTLLIEQSARAAPETAENRYAPETGEGVHQGQASAMISGPRVMASDRGGSAAAGSGPASPDRPAQISQHRIQFE
jgi:hypothetical protein